jgi:hypothetical protein
VARFGVATAVVLATALASAAAVGAKHLDALHPSPVKARPGHAVALCPNPTGLQSFTSVELQRAAHEADAYGRRSLAADLANSDRAWWPRVRALWKTATVRKHNTDAVVGSEPAARSGFAVFLRPACGAAILRRTLMVTVGPSQAGSGPHCDACNAHFFYVERTGRPLLWFIY